MENKMYYDRTLSDSFSQLIEPKGELRWLFEYVRNNSELDFLIGKNANIEWISVYRGLSRVLTIIKTNDPKVIKLEGADAYKIIARNLYGKKDVSENFLSQLNDLIAIVSKDSKFDRYYNNKKEGYYQNELSRKYGICGSSQDDFVIIDKESAVGYQNISVRNETYGIIQARYKTLQAKISSIDEKRFGRDLDKKAIGNELDFLALNKHGKLLLIEFKNGSNTSGVYLSPLQIGMYVELFKQLTKEKFENSIFKMIEQKKRIGLINPDWKIPKITEIVPVLIIANYKSKSVGKEKYHEIMSIMRKEQGDSFLSNIITYNYTTESGLVEW